jgi:hypothetical protein
MLQINRVPIYRSHNLHVNFREDENIQELNCSTLTNVTSVKNDIMY